LQEEIRSLSETTEEQKKIIVDKNKKIEAWKTAHRDSYVTLANVTKAVGMLKYDDGDYKVNSLSPKQERLIDSIADYTAFWVKHDGYPALAVEVEKNIGISKGIQEFVDERTPKVKSRGLSL